MFKCIYVYVCVHTQEGVYVQVYNYIYTRVYVYDVHV